MKLDMHIHTREGSPDAKAGVSELIGRLRAKDFDGMVITDHDSYGGYRAFRRLYPQGVENFTVFRGIEYDTQDAGHMLIVLPTGAELPLLEQRGMKLRDLIPIVHAHGGVIGPAHPCGEPFLSIFSTGHYRRDRSVASRFDFLEGYNSGEDAASNAAACAIAAEYGLPVTGGSDAHWADCAGLSYAILPRRVSSEDELIALLRERPVIRSGGEPYLGTLKARLGRWNKLLVYAFFPYNALETLLHTPARRREMRKAVSGAAGEKRTAD